MKKRLTKRFRIEGIKDGYDLTQFSQDVQFHPDGSVSQRPCVQWFNPSLVAASAAADPQIGFLGATTFGNVIVAGSVNGVYTLKPVTSGSAEPNYQYIDGGSPASATSFDSAVIGDELFIANGVTPILKYGSVGFSLINGQYGAGTQKLVAKTICEYRGLLFAGNTREALQNYPNRIRWTSYANREIFDAFEDESYTSFEDIGDPSDEIILLRQIDNNLIIFKRRSIWIAEGVSDIVAAPQSIRCLTNDVGLVNPNAMAETKSTVVFISDDGLYQIKDGQVTQAGFPCTELMRNNLYRLPSAQIAYNFDDESYIILFPASGVASDRTADNGIAFAITEGKLSVWDVWLGFIKSLRYGNRGMYIIGSPATTYTPKTCRIGWLTTETKEDYYDYSLSVPPNPPAGYYGCPSNLSATVTPLYDTGIIETGHVALRAARFVFENAGDFTATAYFYYDGCQTPYLTETQAMRESFTPVSDSMSETLTGNTDGAVAAAMSSDRKVLIPHFADLDTSVYRFLRIRVTAVWKLFDIEVSYQKRGAF